MVQKLVEWSVRNPLLVFFMGAALAVLGGVSFVKVNVEAYPDPAPAIIEVIAQMPGASAEEMERQVTIPIEVALAGMPGLTSTRSKSLFGLSHLRNQFDYGVDYERAKQEVINRLQQAQLPNGVTPQISPASPIGEIYRYVLVNPKDENGQPIYTLSDLKALQDWSLQRELLRVKRIAGVLGFGGTVKRYEIHPDPDNLRRHGVTLAQLQKALTDSNANMGGDYLIQGQTVQVVRGIGLLGGGQDPMQTAMTMKNPKEAAAYLRAEEARRIREIRQIVVASVNNVPITVDQLVEGGPLGPTDEPGARGVVIGHQTRLGRVSLTMPVKAKEKPGGEKKFINACMDWVKHHLGLVEPVEADPQQSWLDEDDVVQVIVVLRKGQESLPALEDLEAKIRDIRETPGRLLPGVTIEPYYNRTDLIGVTTETVRENLVVGLALVTMILLMFLNNVRTALIVAVNIPLALLFAFATLYLRGKSANLLSIGAVDFGIIVDSTVIMVENIFRHASMPNPNQEPLETRILRASAEVQKSLFFSTIIMVCALLPLFTMKGPEGQIFGPMADTYAFALGGALLLALTISPALCNLLFKNLKPVGDNLLVRSLKWFYLGQLRWCLNNRLVSVGILGLLVAGSLAVLPVLGREFMPELEEGNVFIRGTLRINTSLDNAADKVRALRAILREYPEIQAAVSIIGRPDDGTDSGGYYNVETIIPLKPFGSWPRLPGRDRPRTKKELIQELDDELSLKLPGVEWDFSQIIRDNVMECISGVKGENSIKIFGPDLDELERLGKASAQALKTVPGVDNAGIFRIKGQSNLEFGVHRGLCKQWGVSVQDVMSVFESAVAGKPVTQIKEGEKAFDLTLRWPLALRADEEAIKRIPVDILNNNITSGSPTGGSSTPITGAVGPGTSSTGTAAILPSPTGTGTHLGNPSMNSPQRRLGDLLTPLDAQGLPDPRGQFVRPGASTISRDNGQRFIAVKFGVKGRDLASTVAQAQTVVNPLIQPPYRSEWGGEFQEMEEAEERLAVVVVVSLVLIFLLLCMAFHSCLDALTVFANVLAMSLGGLWALLLTGTIFNISAAVGFISILGVAVMNGLLMISSFNQLRSRGVELAEAIQQGMEKLVRPVTMTALAAILGLLPAALSTRIGSQSQRPLAIVVVGGMMMTLLLMNVAPLLYSFYGKRTPPAGAGGVGH